MGGKELIVKKEKEKHGGLAFQTLLSEAVSSACGLGDPWCSGCAGTPRPRHLLPVRSRPAANRVWELGWLRVMSMSCLGKEWTCGRCALPTLSLGGFVLDKQDVPKGSSRFSILSMNNMP